jgi:CheY-like chemotaxis protein
VEDFRAGTTPWSATGRGHYPGSFGRRRLLLPGAGGGKDGTAPLLRLDLVLLDLRLPRMGGHEVLTEIEQHPDWWRPPPPPKSRARAVVASEATTSILKCQIVGTGRQGSSSSAHSVHAVSRSGAFPCELRIMANRDEDIRVCCSHASEIRPSLTCDDKATSPVSGQPTSRTVCRGVAQQ